MKNIWIITFITFSVYLWGCNSSTSPTEEDKGYLLNYGTKYIYNYGSCDENWNFNKDTISVTMNFINRKYYPEAYFNVFSLSNTAVSGEAAFLEKSFWMSSQVGLPFIDTNFVGSKMYGYDLFKLVKFNPFLQGSENNYKRDTAYVDLYLYQYLTETPMMFPTMLVQEWSGKVLNDTTLNLLGTTQKCKQALLYINRFIRPKYTWQTKKYTRPSDAPELNEFYFDNDAAVYLDKIQMRVIYKEKFGFAEILIRHRSVWGEIYYKWKFKQIGA